MQSESHTLKLYHYQTEYAICGNISLETESCSLDEPPSPVSTWRPYPQYNRCIVQ